MSAAGYLVALVTVLYVGAAIAYARQKNYGIALAFGAYALANVGLIISGENK